MWNWDENTENKTRLSLTAANCLTGKLRNHDDI